MLRVKALFRKLIVIAGLAAITASFSSAGYKANGDIEISQDVLAAGIAAMGGGSFTLDSYVGQTNPPFLWMDGYELFAGFLSVLGDSPYIAITSASQVLGTGNINITVECSDPDKDLTKLKVEYSTSSAVDAARYKATMTGTASASVGPDPDVSTADYQIGSVTPIQTTSTNTVTFVWNSRANLPDQEDTFYLIVTVSDGFLDYSAAIPVVIDNSEPSVSGLTKIEPVGNTYIYLGFTGAAVETNFSEYKIAYSTNSDIDSFPTIFDQNDDTALGDQYFLGKSDVQVSGLITNAQYYFRLDCYDSYGNVGKSTILGPIVIKAVPSASVPIETVLQDGSDYVLIVSTVSEIDNDNCALKVEYSLENGIGGSWRQAYISNVVGNNGNPTIDNDREYQVGASTDIATPNTLTMTWDLTQESITNSTNATEVLIRLTPISEDIAKDAGDVKVSSTAFTIDTDDPVVPGNLTARVEDLTASSITWDWTGSSDFSFTKYEIWYATFTGVARFGTNVNLWSTTEDSNLSNAAATSTVITGLEEGTTYYARIWAFDNYGHISVSVGESFIRTESRPVVSFIAVPAQSIVGDGRVPVSARLSDLDLDKTLQMRVEYSSVSASGPFAKANIESSVTSSYGIPPDVNQANFYQIGDAQLIDVSQGQNDLNFTWQSAIDLPSFDVDTVYLRLTVFDGTNSDAPVESSQFDIDNINPAYVRSEYTHAGGELIVEFDETINAHTLIHTGITLTNDIESFTLLPSETAVIDGVTTTVRYSISIDHIKQIAAWQRGNGILKIALAQGVIKDIKGNLNNALTKVNVDTWNKDTEDPSLIVEQSGYSFFTRILKLKFSELMTRDTLTNSTIGGITLQDNANRNNTSNYISLSSENSIDVSIDTDTFNLTLTEAQWRTVASWGNTDLFIAISSTTIQDLSGQAVNPINPTNAAKLDAYNKDNSVPVISSQYPLSDSFKLKPTGLNIVIKFNELMYKSDTEAAISVVATRDNYSHEIRLPILGTIVYSDADKSLTFTPTGGFKYNHRYEVTLTNQAQDISRNKITAAKKWIFQCIMNHEEENIIIADDGETIIEIPEGFLPENAYLITNTDPIFDPHEIDPNKIINANKKRESASEFNTTLPGSIREFNLYDTSDTNLAPRLAQKVDEITNNTTAASPTGLIKLSIPYPDADNDGIVDGSNPPVRVSTLRVYWLDEENGLWVKVPRFEIDIAAKRITTEIRHFSVYALAGAPDYSLTDAYAYPVPYKPREPRHKDITFTNLASECKIKIFTISGELVNTLEHTDSVSTTPGRFVWDVKSEAGNDVFSGLYIYLITSKHDKKTGKLMIIR
ncbi:Ig-like domain-containing protein [bacterium]